MADSKRCAWAAGDDDLMRAYHDNRWCKPVHDGAELYALLVLEGMQAGLSWSLILKREAGIRAACDGLDPAKVAVYDEAKEQELLLNPSLIRSKAKVHMLRANALAFQEVQREYGSFDAYIWGFTNGSTIDHRLESAQDMPAQNDLSVRVSKDLKKRRFKFVGPVIVYSYLQAIGVINDHALDCPFR